MAKRSSMSRKAGRSRPPAHFIASIALAVVLVCAFAIEAYGDGLPGFASAESRMLRERINTDAPEIVPVYEARNYEPIWVEGGKVRPEARALVAASQTEAL